MKREYHVKSIRPDHISPVIIEGEELDVALQVIEQLRLGYTRIEITVKQQPDERPNDKLSDDAPAFAPAPGSAAVESRKSFKSAEMLRETRKNKP